MVAGGTDSCLKDANPRCNVTEKFRKKLQTIVILLDLNVIPIIMQDSFSLQIIFKYAPAPVRTVGEQSYRIRDFHLRFFGAQSMRETSPEVTSTSQTSIFKISNLCP